MELPLTVYFGKYIHVLQLINEVEFHFLLYLCPVLCTWEEFKAWFTNTKIRIPLYFNNIKSQDDFYILFWHYIVK